eukprot:1156533-Pelagomonas_calceolata.AAC.4
MNEVGFVLKRKAMLQEFQKQKRPPETRGGENTGEEPPPGKRKRKEKLYRQRERSLRQLRKRGHIDSKSRESPSPEGKREASVGLVGSWRHAAPGHQCYVECCVLPTPGKRQFTILRKSFLLAS